MSYLFILQSELHILVFLSQLLFHTELRVEWTEKSFWLLQKRHVLNWMWLWCPKHKHCSQLTVFEAQPLSAVRMRCSPYCAAGREMVRRDHRGYIVYFRRAQWLFNLLLVKYSAKSQSNRIITQMRSSCRRFKSF